jgi:phage gpG-like protein
MVAKVGIRGLPELEKYLKKVSKELLSRKTFGPSSLVMLQDVNKHFVNSESPIGKWASLKIRSGKPLQKTGRLKGSIKTSFDNRSANVGTNLKYATLQNDGGTIRPKQARRLYIPLTNRASRKRPGSPIPKGFKWGRDFVLASKAVIPKRPFMWLSKLGENRIINQFIRFLDQA